MTKDIGGEIANHLEFLGYEIKAKNKGEAGTSSFLALSQDKSNLFVITNDVRTSSVFSAHWSGYQNKALKSIQFHETINQANKKDVTKWYYEVDEDEDTKPLKIVIESIYYGYSKHSFGSFLDVFNSEITANLPEFNAFFVEPDSKNS